MSETEIRMMRYTMEQLSAELQAIRQYASDIKSKLERTRKELDLSCGALKEISLTYQNGLDKPVAPAKWFSIATDMCDYADNAIEQVTALEQKDVK